MPNITVKDVLLQLDTNGRRGQWLTKILEFDVEIKPTKLIKGQGLAHLMFDSKFKALNMNVEVAEGEDGEGIANYPEIFNSDWYKDIV